MKSVFFTQSPVGALVLGAMGSQPFLAHSQGAGSVTYAIGRHHLGAIDIIGLDTARMRCMAGPIRPLSKFSYPHRIQAGLTKAKGKKCKSIQCICYNRIQ